MDGEDLELFERSIRYATDNHTGAELDDALAELGWSDAMAVDPRAAVSVLFELQGATNTTSSALDLVLGSALDPQGRPGAGVVLPAVGGWGPPGSVADGDLVVNGVATAALAGLESTTIVASAGQATSIFTLATAALQLDPIEGVDPGFGLLSVTGTISDPPAGSELAPEQWTSAVARGRLAVAHELVGSSRRMLELAREHALERVQFGRTISSFQAIRHRLAETLVAIESAEAVLDAAWLDGTADSAAMAKAVAGRGARTTMRHCQQTLAGIGFTTEHDLHLHIRRIHLLDALFGTSVTLTRALGEQLIANRALPPLLPL